MAETLLQKAQRLGIQPAGTATPAGTETLEQKAVRLGIKPAGQPTEKSFFEKATETVISPTGLPVISPSYAIGAGKRIFGAIKEDITKGISGVEKEAKVIAEGKPAEAPAAVLRGGLRAAGAGARAVFEPLTIPLVDAIQAISEKASDLPAVQRIAMSDKVGNILGKTKDFGITLGDFAKNNPELGQDIKDVADIALSVLGTKGLKTITRAEVGVAEKGAIVGERPPAGPGGAMEKAVAITDTEAGTILSTPARSAKKPEVLPIFQKYGIEPPVSAVTESRAVAGAEGILQSAWLGGTKITKIVDEARDSIFKITESLRKRLDPETLKTAGVSEESVGKHMQEAVKSLKTEFDNVKNKLYDDATSKIGKQQATLEETKKALDEIIAQKRASSDPSARAQATYYERFRNNLSTAEKRTFQNIKQTRTDVGRKIKSIADPIATGDAANLKRLYATLSKDLDVTITQSGTEAASALKTADAYYKAGIQRINSAIGRTIFRSRSPETLVGKLVDPRTVSELRELRGLVGEDVFKQVGSLFMNNLIEKSIIPLTGRLNARKLADIMARYGDDALKEIVGLRGLQQLKDLRKSAIVDDILEKGTANGKVLPGRLANAMDSYEEKILREAFSPEELQKLKDVRAMSGAMAKGTKIVEGSPTAEKSRIIIDILVGVGPGLGTLAAKIGAEWGLTKLFTTPWGRRLLGVKKGSNLAKTGGQEAGGATLGVSEAKVAPEGGKVAKTGGSVLRYSEKEVNMGKKLDTPKTMPTGAPEMMPARVLYHGTSAKEFNRFGNDVVYLTKNKKEAEVFAEDPIVGGGRGVGKPRIIEASVPSGKIKNISDDVEKIIMDGDDLDSFILDQAKIARKEGYEFLSFNHPSSINGADDFDALVAINPSKIKIKKPGRRPHSEMEK